MDVAKRCIEGVKFGGVGGQEKKARKKGGVASDKANRTRDERQCGKEQMQETSSRREHSDGII